LVKVVFFVKNSNCPNYLAMHPSIIVWWVIINPFRSSKSVQPYLTSLEQKMKKKCTTLTTIS
jgi:hypothetical protein